MVNAVKTLQAGGFHVLIGSIVSNKMKRLPANNWWVWLYAFTRSLTVEWFLRFRVLRQMTKTLTHRSACRNSFGIPFGLDSRQPILMSFQDWIFVAQNWLGMAWKSIGVHNHTDRYIFTRIVNMNSVKVEPKWYLVLNTPHRHRSFWWKTTKSFGLACDNV